MTSAVRMDLVVERLRQNADLAQLGLTAAAEELLRTASGLVGGVPAGWIEGECSLRSDIAESVALLCGDVCDAIRAEIDEPRTRLSVVGSGE